MSLRSAAFALGIVTAAVPAVRAVCVFPLSSPCEMLAHSAVVLVADVLEPGMPPRLGFGKLFVLQTVKLRVVERFKGISRDADEITRSIWVNEETVFPTAGQRWVIYANFQNGGWDTRCTRTKPAADTEAEVAELRKCSGG